MTYIPGDGGGGGSGGGSSSSSNSTKLCVTVAAPLNTPIDLVENSSAASLGTSIPSVRRSAQQCWRNAMVTLPTGRVRHEPSRLPSFQSSPCVPAELTHNHVLVRCIFQALRVVTEKDITAKDIRKAARSRTSRARASDMDPALEVDSTWSGGSIWGSSELLAQVLIEKQLQFWQEHPRVLELGTGCGLVAIVAAAMGARYVVATDQIIHMAQHNVEANFLFSTKERKRVDVRRLRWGCAEDMSAILSLRSDYSRDADEDDQLQQSKKRVQDPVPYDLILGSDCIYNRDSHASLATTIDSMAGVGATVLW